MLLDSIQYKQKLETIAAQLGQSSDSVEIRGTDVAQFIYATKDGRSIEISQCQEGVWIECRLPKDDYENSREFIVENYDEAVKTAFEWFDSEIQ